MKFCVECKWFKVDTCYEAKYICTNEECKHPVHKKPRSATLVRAGVCGNNAVYWEAKDD